MCWQAALDPQQKHSGSPEIGGEAMWKVLEAMTIKGGERGVSWERGLGIPV